MERNIKRIAQTDKQKQCGGEDVISSNNAGPCQWSGTGYTGLRPYYYRIPLQRADPHPR